MSSLEPLLKKTGDILLSYFGKPELSSSFKTSKDLVSEADRHAEEFLIESLSKMENIRFLSEEFNPDEPIKKEPLWIIDPLDGTTNFIAGLMPFAVSVAHFNGEFVDFSASYIPVTGEFFSAEKGCGAWCNGVRLHVSDNGNPINSVCATGFADIVKGLDKDTFSVFEQVLRKTRAVRRMGSAVIDMAFTAAGRFDFFWEHGLSSWDIAAGVLMIEEAGGIVTDFDGGRNYFFDRTIIASNRNMYSFIKSEIDRNFLDKTC